MSGVLQPLAPPTLFGKLSFSVSEDRPSYSGTSSPRMEQPLDPASEFDGTPHSHVTVRSPSSTPCSSSSGASSTNATFSTTTTNSLYWGFTYRNSKACRILAPDHLTPQPLLVFQFHRFGVGLPIVNLDGVLGKRPLCQLGCSYNVWCIVSLYVDFGCIHSLFHRGWRD